MEAQMYPLTDDPKYTMDYEDFTELREAVEGMDDGLNFVVSWFVSDEKDDWGDDEFGVLIFMPRKTATLALTTSVFDREEVSEWINGYVKQRVMEWYGWS